MQTPITHRFYKGIDSDTSYTERDGTAYLDAQNIRLVRREGQSLWAVTMGSTEELFELPVGYVPIGSVYHRGVLFLLVHNETTGYSQIGSYPSPDPANGYAYERIYRPILFTKQAPWEYISDGCTAATPPTLQSLQTNQLGLSLDNALGMLARSESDNSVTLYWTDGVQPIRLANTCFDVVTGRPTGRYLSEKELMSGQWDLVNENAHHPNYQLLGVPTGGALKAGHTFITVRYTDTQYGATSFLSISAPVPVFNSTPGGIPQGGQSDETTDKKIEMLITGLDPDAALIEVGVVRYTSQSEYEAYLIANRYILDGSGTLSITITGNESTIALSIDEVIALKPYDARIAFCMAQLNNTLYIGNTTGRQLDHPDLRELACLIELDEHTETVDTVRQIDNTNSDQAYGKNPSDVFDKVGYFSGEVYTFALLPVLKGGFYGLPIPVHGTDHYTGSSVGTNEKGNFRFSAATTVPYHNGADAVAKAIKFLTSNPAVAAHIAASQWIQDNVIGFYLCRAERRENMICQGVQTYAYNGRVSRRWQYDTPPIPGNVDEIYSNFLGPLFEPATYGVLFGKDHGGFAGTSDVAGFSYYAGAPTDADKKLSVGTGKACIVSHDYAISKVKIPTTVHVRRHQWVQQIEWWRTFDVNNDSNVVTFTDIDPSTTHYGMTNGLDVNIDLLTADLKGTKHFVGYDHKLSASTWIDDKYDTEAVDVPAWQNIPVGGGRFVSRREEGTSASNEGFYFINPDYATFPARNKDFSLPIAHPTYIGVEHAPPSMFPYDKDSLWNTAVVAVYHSDPDLTDVSTYYQPTAEFYYPIGDYIRLDDLGAQDYIRWQGDCFIARAYMRLVSGHTESIGTDLLDLIAQKEAVFDPFYPEIDLERGWGYWISYVSEHRYNPNYRIERGRNLYYPATGVGDEGTFAWQLDSPESDFYNKSYTRTLGGRGLIPIDPLQPLSAGRFISRIRASFTHVTGAVRDGYRQFAETDKYDLDYSRGELYALVPMNENLYSVQEGAINLHPINERSTQSTDKGTTFVTGGLQKLPPYRTYISDKLGTQHRFGVVAGMNGLYGFDNRQRVWWRVQGLQVEDLTLSKHAYTWLYQNLIAPLLSDRLSDRPDRPLRRSGVQMVMNMEYGEIWLTLYNPSPITLVFSELLDAYQCRVTVAPTLYTPMGKELISFNGDHVAHHHDGIDSDLVFYGQQQQATLRMVYGDGGETVKHWDALILNQNNTKWKEIRYETQHQRATQIFDNPSERWYRPIYREMQWKQSIRRADATVEPFLSLQQINSRMRGTYMVLELVYEDSKHLWIREAIALITPSKA